jgi:deoxyribose-phosphate aldolase
MDKNEIKSGIASFIDHTNLRADAKREAISQLCAQALEYRFAAVCVLPHFVRQASEELENSGIKTVTVIGFPLGATYTTSKVLEADIALLNGAAELDMVMNISALKNGETKMVQNDIEAVANLCIKKKAILKVIIESALLTNQEIEQASRIASIAQAHYVKTSTGFFGGATREAVEIIKNSIPGEMKIKASGGIKTLDQALDMIDSGASRIGTSSAIEIMQEAETL